MFNRQMASEKRTLAMRARAKVRRLQRHVRTFLRSMLGGNAQAMQQAQYLAFNCWRATRRWWFEGADTLTA